MSLLNNYTLANDQTSYYAVAGSGIPIPGPPGPTGPVGPTGPQGLSIFSGAGLPNPGDGVVGDLYVNLDTSELYKKVAPANWQPEFYMIGPAGQNGAAATVAVGGTITLPAGSPAAVNNSGTAQNAILNFAIPQGAVGATGATGPQGPPGSAADAALWSTFPATQAVDMCGNDLENLGSLTVAGIGNTVDFGTVLPANPALARFSVLSSEVGITHLDPLTAMTIRGQGDVRVESTAGDLNLVGDDVNISTTGATNVLNITSLGVLQNTAGGAINNSAGGAFAVQAGGLVSILTTGSIQIGSGNVLGATTSIEKLDIDDSVVTKVAGASDLQFQNTALVQNSGDPTRKVHVEAVDANTEIFGQGVIIKTTGEPAGATTGDIQFQVGAATPLVIANATGIATFNTLAPQCAVVPAAADDLTNKAYVDTKLPADTDISFGYNFAVPIATPDVNGPFLYVPAGNGPPTGAPTNIAGAAPLYLDTTGGGVKLYAYTGGVWNAI